MEIFGADLNGIDGQLIKFAATKDDNNYGTRLLGLAQKVVREGLTRATKAIETLDGAWGELLYGSGYTIQLSPAGMPKTSAGLDLPLAIMLLQASILQNVDSLKEEIVKLEEKLTKEENGKSRDVIKQKILSQIDLLIKQKELANQYRKRIAENKNKYLMIGTLDIVTGKLMPPEFGMLGMISCAKPDMIVIIPEDSEQHGAIIAKARKDLKIFKANNLQEVWNILLGAAKPNPVKYDPSRITTIGSDKYVPDLKAIKGVARAKYAMIVALAGGHNILLVGPPGQGKTMLASAATGLLPELNQPELLEINRIYSASGQLSGNSVIVKRPFVEVQNNVTEAALFGGGTKPVVPGLVSRAHKGILLLDEINLMQTKLLDELRSTLSNKVQKVQRNYYSLEFPANFILVAAMNPCKCGWYNHYHCPVCGDLSFSFQEFCTKHPEIKMIHRCQCKQSDIDRFKDKLSQPILDRIDLKVMVSSFDKIEVGNDYASSTLKKVISKARDRQHKRFKEATYWNSNASVPDKSQFDRYCTPIDDTTRSYISRTYRELKLTKRMEVKLLLVSQTIADLQESGGITIQVVESALEVMGLRHEYFRNFN